MLTYKIHSACITVLFVVATLLYVSISYGQGNQNQARLHKVNVKAGHFFIVSDSAIYVSKDTTLFIPDTVDYYQRKHSLKKSRNFYRSIDTKLHQSYVSKMLYKLVFQKPAGKRNKQQVESIQGNENSEVPYQEYGGKLVGNFRFKHLEIFGTDVNDTTRHPNGFQKHMNTLHIQTHNRIIVNNLLISPGTRLTPADLADNERILRQLPFIKDSRIHVIPKEDSPDVDLLIITKDVFPLKFDVRPRGVTSSIIGISNINIAGSGHELESDFIIDNDEPGGLGFDLTYRIPNLRGSFIASELNYANTFERKGYGLRVFRDFITPEIRYAGGFEVNRYERNIPRIINIQTDSVAFVNVKSSVQDVWGAKAVKSYANPPLKGIKERIRMTISGRIFREDFTERPEVEKDSNYVFHDRTLYLTSFGISRRKYFKGYLITNFGRTEDIPIGHHMQITAGFESSEFDERFYGGIQLSKGGLIKSIGYLRLDANLGGFFSNTLFEHGVLRFDAFYFSQLYALNLLRIRQFLSSNYTLGLRRDPEELIDINNDNGLRGASGLMLTGKQRFTINGETVVFTPIFFLGFRLATFGYFDLGIIGSNRRSLLSGKAYYGFGLGIRLKNDNLAFSTIQIRVGFYSDLPENTSTRNFRFLTQTNLPLRDFDIKRPSTVTFE